MRTITVDHYDAFTRTPGRGNPAGVISEAEDFTGEEMQEIARQIGFSECAFLLPSQRADLRLRYFTPGVEVNLCGHATMASIYALYKELDPQTPPFFRKVETAAGIIDVGYDPASKEVSMTHADATFLPFEGSIAGLMATIGLKEEDYDSRYPITYGSTGLWTLLLPVKNLEACQRMVPDHHAFPAQLTQMPNCSIHPFCTQTYREEATLHGRHFSAAVTGRVEDPVTGTASGVMGAYYIQTMKPALTSCDIFIEQGQEAGYDGLVRVWARKEGKAIQVKIAGQAVYVDSLEARLP